ncbi:MAG: hypothetical protein Q4G14_01640 [Paracoccus sp. (in: a-proteobacteria)]|uniref:hypothetical protein n=1 Tax=Paracoccus sp. TaxID=267 RepID=UPI0026E0AB54|nr:hypothetical protein [Paracoccus sp. (in: a-proteobacteria)]MDO5611928.1 hypothetical protein [Paracoccus sp. (in: a-proteobacteria)]
MLEQLHRWFADFNNNLGRAMVLRYGGGAFISKLPQRLEQDLPVPRDGTHSGSSRARAEVSSIGRLVRQLDGG